MKEKLEDPQRIHKDHEATTVICQQIEQHKRNG